ncbi:MAG: glycosidase, partial [Nanoarchaeota archaeon]|nr:glycosidase [Nanoarchaeota archaeon]
AALFEKNNPQKLIARSYPDVPLLSPKEDYEKEGYMKNVLFPTGLIEESKGNLLLYSGCADTYVGVKRVHVDEILKHIKRGHLK